MRNMTCACHIGGTENTKYQCIPSSFDILTIGTCKKCAATVIMGIFFISWKGKRVHALPGDNNTLNYDMYLI